MIKRIILRNNIKVTMWACMAIFFSCTSASTNGIVKTNQIGYYPNGPKLAIVEGEKHGANFFIISYDEKDTVYSGKLGEKRASQFSGDITHIVDFSAFQDTGIYVLSVENVGKSYPFQIRPNVHQSLAKAAIKSYYFQRMSIDLPEQFAGKWARPAGHPDTVVLVHASAVSPNRPENTVIAAPQGWYDAGDYNKYVVNSGITMGTLLSLYEDFPEYLERFSIDIPESDNQIPDLLDEVLWNLRWMLAMQDPEDGGVYHKLTAADFEGMIMPHEAKYPRYVVQKSTTAALNFAAVLAQSARIFRAFDAQLPGLADSCVHAALHAWDWAVENPRQLYDQSALNKTFEPKITTGGYGDSNPSDEFIWAASELWITTNDDRFKGHIALADAMQLPSWNQVSALGYYSLLRHKNKLEPDHAELSDTLKSNLILFAGSLLKNLQDNAFVTVMGGSEQDFVWGSNAVAANQGIALIQAYLLTEQQEYLAAALSNLDYILGRNATGYSFVTGYGSKTPMHPHHRPSVADDVEEPVPGLLAGGPNPGQQDNCSGYPSKAADKSYVDSDCSYASNEVAINWSAPLVYLATAIEILQKDLKNAPE